MRERRPNGLTAPTSLPPARCSSASARAQHPTILFRRGSGYAAVPPDKITIYRGPLERLYGRDREELRAQVRRVVLHEIAHHFGISDERLEELGRY